MPAASETVEPLASVQLALEFAEANWNDIGGFDEPFSVSVAIECFVNDLLDHARELGYHVTHQGEEICVVGICVREEVS
jgi:hypothetical protein